MRARGLFGAGLVICGCAMLLARLAWAEGAVAVGNTGDVVRHGIAFGMVVNEPKSKAADVALRRCRTFKAREAAEQCKVVATFLARASRWLTIRSPARPVRAGEWARTRSRPTSRR